MFLNFVKPEHLDLLIITMDVIRIEINRVITPHLDLLCRSVNSALSDLRSFSIQASHTTLGLLGQAEVL
ncbi:hypothetical protein FGO68_gene4079 [Halteria grandinella]|uniref:Uncharacterized protein n=1 Tax=Halteria grandinella TaxID=5974 RepID=A0A8J8SY86_HALGN|nr:hypothetical protein FGO68_gene4079 [Halteria grandinella]